MIFAKTDEANDDTPLEQNTLLDDVQLAVEHGTSNETVELKFVAPKRRPEIVRRVPPLGGVFNAPNDVTLTPDSSNINPAIAVPATPPTLTADTPYIVLA